LFLPAKVPQVIVNQFNGEIVKIMATPVMQKRLFDIGAESRDDNPAQFAKFIAQESQAWGQRIRQLEIKPE
jgi:tripartite-type tricarboxylate transporter receptor subunit TctC